MKILLIIILLFLPSCNSVPKDKFAVSALELPPHIKQFIYRGYRYRIDYENHQFLFSDRESDIFPISKKTTPQDDSNAHKLAYEFIDLVIAQDNQNTINQSINRPLYYQNIGNTLMAFGSSMNNPSTDQAQWDNHYRQQDQMNQIRTINALEDINRNLNNGRYGRYR